MTWRTWRLLPLLVFQALSLAATVPDDASPSPFHLALAQEMGGFPTQMKPRDCGTLFSNLSSELSTGPQWPPPMFIPKELLRHFTMNGSVHIASSYNHPNTFRGAYHYWKKSIIEGLISGKDKSDKCSGHWKHDCFSPLKKNEQWIRDKVGLVVGSEYPWAESLLLRLGVKQLVTIERVRTVLDYPGLTAYTFEGLAELVRRGEAPSFDFGFSYSSIDHEGLGKKGEGLNPNGDIELMDRIHCLLKPGGVLFLAVPVGPDFIHWNTYRTYGKQRLPLLLEGWKVLNVLGNFTSLVSLRDKPSHKQPILMLQKN